MSPSQDLIQLLDFDTNLFGLRCARINYSEELKPEDIDSIISQAQNDHIEHIVIKVPFEKASLIQALERRGFYFTVGSLGLSKKVLQSTSLPNSIRTYKEQDLESLLDITRLSFDSGTRFHAESLFSSKQVHSLHQQWIRNEIQNSEVETLIWEHQGKALGYLTRQKSKKSIHIGLFAVHPDHRGLKGGQKLLAAAESQITEFPTTLTVATECHNFPALSAYTSGGYRIHSAVAAYHWKLQP